MQSVFKTERLKYRKRKDFTSLPEIISIPDLILIQKKSFEKFLQLSEQPQNRKIKDLEGVFREIFPISNLNGTASLEYLGYEVGHWECGCGEYKEQIGRASCRERV